MDANCLRIKGRISFLSREKVRREEWRACGAAIDGGTTDLSIGELNLYILVFYAG